MFTSAPAIFVLLPAALCSPSTTDCLMVPSIDTVPLRKLGMANMETSYRSASSDHLENAISLSLEMHSSRARRLEGECKHVQVHGDMVSTIAGWCDDEQQLLLGEVPCADGQVCVVCSVRNELSAVGVLCED